MLVLMIGLFVTAVSVAIHVLGSTRWLSHLARKIAADEGPKEDRGLFLALLSTAMVLLLLHVVEVVVWAVVYVALPGRAGLTGIVDSVYFSIVTFTTLGYGDITLTADWHPLAGMEAMAGIMVFGLTTAIMFAVISRTWKIARNVAEDTHQKL